MRQEIQIPFNSAFIKLESLKKNDPGILQLKNIISHYLEMCDKAEFPSVLAKSRLQDIIGMMKSVDDLANHGYLNLALSELKSKRKEQGSELNFAPRTTLLTMNHGKYFKLSEEIEELDEVLLTHEIFPGDTMSYDRMFFDHGIDKIKEHGVQFRISAKQKLHSLGKINDVNLSVAEGETEGSGYVISHDSDGNIHHVLHIKKPEGYDNNLVITKTAVANPKIKSPAKMHDIYHHLLGRGFMLMSDEEQSEGGLNVWKKLAKKPGVNVYGWDIKNNVPINTDRHLRSTDDTHKSYDDGEEENNHDIRSNVRLIASKRMLQEDFIQLQLNRPI